MQANWGDTYNKLMENIGNEYTKAHPETKINWIFEDDYQTKFLTTVAGGDPPDIVEAEFYFQASLNQKGAVMQLDNYFQTAGLTPDMFVEAVYKYCVYKGKIYGVPGGSDFLCVFWNKSLYQDAGLDPEAPPKTLAELLDHSKKILKFGSDGAMERVGLIPGRNDFWFWAFQMGGDFYDEKTNKITANNEKNVEALTQLSDYVKLMDPTKLDAFQSGRPGLYEAGNPFSTKQSAYALDGFWTYEVLDQYAPDIQYGVVTYPTLSGKPEEMKNYWASGWAWALANGGKQPDPAWAFTKYAMVDNSAKMGYITLNGPSVKAQMPEFEQGMKEKLGPNNRMTNQLGPFTTMANNATKSWPAIPVSSYYKDEIERAIDYAIHQKKSPKEALDECTSNVQAELDKVS